MVLQFDGNVRFKPLMYVNLTTNFYFLTHFRLFMQIGKTDHSPSLSLAKQNTESPVRQKKTQKNHTNWQEMQTFSPVRSSKRSFCQSLLRNDRTGVRHVYYIEECK